MISREDVRVAINEAEVEYLKAWSALEAMRLTDPPITADALLSLQSALATGIYKLARTYHDLSAEKRSYIERKEELTDQWFRNRMRLLNDYQEAIHTAISVGKSIGDAFAWFFYHRERKLLLEHGKHPVISIPPIGAGGRGELALAKSAQVINGHLLLHHGITNLLRNGDISVISIPDMEVIAIAEIKTMPLDARTLQISMVVAGTDREKLERFINATLPKGRQGDSPAQRLSQQPQVRLSRQLDQIGRSLARPDADRNESLHLQSSIQDLKKVFDVQGHVPASVHRVGRSQVVVRMDLRDKTLADRIMRGPSPSQLNKMEGLEEATIGTTVENRTLNSLYIGEPYNPSAKSSTSPVLVPMFWWPIDRSIPKSLIFHKTILFSIFNVGPFLREIQKLGFEVVVDGHRYAARKPHKGNVIHLENLQFYFNLIVLGFTRADSIMGIINKLLEAIEEGELPLDTRIELAITQELFGSKPDA